MGEIPLPGNDRQCPVKLPCPAMKGATQLVHAAAFGAQHRASVQAGVYIGANFVWGGADNDQRIMDNFIDNVIADVGDMFNATGQLPAFPPDLLNFLVMPLF
jgi:hypothetical protein